MSLATSLTKTRFKRPSAGRLITGVDEVDAALARLGSVKVANRIARNALGQGVRVIAKEIKAKVPSGHKGLRAAIGSRVGSGRGRGRSGGMTEAKAGAGVAKKPIYGPPMKRTAPGVGASVENIHWFILGATGAKAKYAPVGPPRMHKTGKSTGIMRPPHWADFVKQGGLSGLPKAATKMRKATRELMLKEMRKATK